MKKIYRKILTPKKLSFIIIFTNKVCKSKILCPSSLEIIPKQVIREINKGVIVLEKHV